jgi:hypothetical protein
LAIEHAFRHAFGNMIQIRVEQIGIHVQGHGRTGIAPSIRWPAGSVTAYRSDDTGFVPRSFNDTDQVFLTIDPNPEPIQIDSEFIDSTATFVIPQLNRQLDNRLRRQRAVAPQICSIPTVSKHLFQFIVAEKNCRHKGNDLA